MSRRPKRAALLGLAAAALVLTACNPLAGQPTEVRSGTGVTSSWDITYTGDGGVLQVAVTSAPASAVAVRAYVRDPAHWGPWFPICIYTTPNVAVWSAGQSLGYQTIGRLWGPADFFIEADATGGPITFDVRVLGNDGTTPIGDMVHHTPQSTGPPAPAWDPC